VSALLEVRSLSAGYARTTVLHAVDLDVAAGEAVCVLGPNGAGKTTLLHALSGTVPHVDGSVVLDGRPIARVKAHRRVRLGLVHVPEGRRAVIPSMTVAENLRLAARGAASSLADAEDLFPILAARRAQRAGTLSGGQQQMLALALGFVLEPRVLLVDEPSAGLAPAAIDEVFARLAAMVERGIALLLAEQRVDLALGIADRGYVLEAGRIVTSGSAAELGRSEAVATAYLGDDAVKARPRRKGAA